MSLCRAACPSFPAGGLPRRRAAHPSRKGWSAAIFGTGRAGSLRNRRAATASARDGALCVETARRLLCAALSPPAWDARAAEGVLRGAEVRLAASGVLTAGRSLMQKLPVIGKPRKPVRSLRRAMFFLLRCGTRTAITRFPSSAWEEGSAASLGRPDAGGTKAAMLRRRPCASPVRTPGARGSRHLQVRFPNVPKRGVLSAGEVGLFPLHHFSEKGYHVSVPLRRPAAAED